MMQFEATYSSSQFLWTKGDKNTSPFVYIDDANWPLFPLEQGSAREGIIKAGGSIDFTQTPPSPVPHTDDNILLATLALKCVGPGSEVFDFTDSGESFHLIKPSGSGEFTVDTTPYALTITCGPGTNHPPVAEGQSVQTNKNQSLDIITLEATDQDNNPLTYSIVDGPTHGTLSNFDPDAGTVTYTPDSEYTGSDSFTFKANDGEEDSNEATVSIEVEEPGANNPPVAKDQSKETLKNQSLDITLEATDADDGDSLTYSIVDDPSHGTLSGTPPHVTYTPDSEYTGSDSFTFKANDGEEDSNEATVSIKVKGGGENFQSITPEPGSINPTPGWEFHFSVKYDASNNDLSGIGFYVHYNSRYLEFVKVSNVLPECYGLPGDPEVENDTEDYDKDPSTDKRFVVFWADFTPPSSWPGVELPLNLMDVTFKVKEEALINTSINFTGKTAAGYDFVSEPLKICDLDIKANGQDGPITLHSSDILNITISIDNNGRTEDADWWLAVDAPFGIWFYTLEFWTETLLPAYQGPLFYYPYPFKIIRDIPVSWLRAGTYIFYFGVDTFMDGDITWNICYDAVEVNIE
jgi:hypothetical protein